MKGWCESEKHLVEKFAEAVSCLANAQGGAVIVGVESDLTGVHKFSCCRYPNVNAGWISARIQDMTVPPVGCEVFDLTGLLDDIGIANANAFGISIPRKTYLGQHFTVKGVSKIRRGKDCKPYLTTAEDDRTGTFVQDITIADLSLTSIAWAQARHRSTFQTGGTSCDTAEFLSRARLVEPFLIDGETEPRYRVRLAALILFGKQTAIARHVPFFETIVTFGPNTNTVRLQKNLVETMKELVFSDSALLGDYSPAIPTPTVQELLINAYVHRCWRTPAPVMIDVTTEFAVHNPGGLLPGLSPGNLLYCIPQYRNFTLAEAARFIGLCDKIGHGINVVFDSVVSGGFPFPEFASDHDNFHAHISLTRRAEFAEFVRRRAASLGNLDEILALRFCWDQTDPISIDELRNVLQRDTKTTRAVLEAMCSKNMIESVDQSQTMFQLTSTMRRDILTVFEWDQYELFR